MATVPHLALPFQVDLINGAPVVEQDSLDEVTQCVAVLLGSEPGDHPMLPTYGIPDLLFSQQVDTGSIVQAVNQWEPRANISVAAGVGPQAPITVNVAIDGPAPTATAGITILPSAVGAALAPAPVGNPIYDGGNAVVHSPAVYDGGDAGLEGTEILDGGDATTA